MRVHRLEVTAFGPFAETQVIDFEPLNAAGVFLLTGPTGAGKTSILDAICFALFGQVPGVRDRAKAYRSHHAATGTAPRVALEVTLQGRRLRLTRQASWPRPSGRARSGFVTEQARATAEELVGGEWVARSSRVDEVGHLVSRLLGLNRDQFCQVVMLPQGDFQAFLRAGGRDRQQILESLFATQRFQAVERWLVEHRRQQSRRCRDHEELLGRLVARLQEVCAPEVVPLADPGVGLPAVASASAGSPAVASAGSRPVAGAGAGAVDHGAVLTWLRHRVGAGQARAVEAAGRVAESASLAKQARHLCDEARALADRQGRHRAALQRRATLTATRDLVAAREQAVRRARAAAELLPLVELVADDEAVLATAERAVILSRSQGAGVLALPGDGPVTVELLEELLAGLGEEMAGLRVLLPAQARCDRLGTDLAALAAAVERAVSAVGELDAQIAADPGLLAGLRTDLVEVEQVAMRFGTAEESLASAARAVAAADEVRLADAELADLRAGRLEARESAAVTAERWLDARERYLAGVAADLAGTLTAGDPCPVCGATSHPEPAVAHAEHVSRAHEADLLAAVNDARARLASYDDEMSAAERARGAALVRSGGLDLGQARAALAAARDERDLVSRAAAERVAVMADLERLGEQAESHRAGREAAATELARLQERMEACRRELDTESARLTTLVGPGTRVADRLAGVEAGDRACRALLTAVRAADEAARATGDARARLAGALERSEFVSAAAVLEAALTPSEIANAEALNRSHAAELVSVEQVLADPVLADSAARPAPDLEDLESAADLVARSASDTAAASADLQRRQGRLEELLGELEAGVAELVPLRAAKGLADDVAGLCTGSSPDNPTRTALSHYVLAARLEQVVAAANVRLDSICSGRYQLAHTMTREAGDNRGGLGLLVQDTHTDCDRDPATLSGGETFYVSLSLALGLADVVTNEVGGAELSTLFVDEGFGGLDDHTRDEVLDELDALRSGGRTIGLVSHLSELRARFPVQLRVLARRSGSQCLIVSDGEAE